VATIILKVITLFFYQDILTIVCWWF